MRSQSRNTVYDQVVRITQTYLGPAANRFVARQVENHLHKNPEDLSLADVLLLIDWIRVAVALLTEDSSIVEAYIAQLQKLADNYEKPKNSSRSSA